MATPIDINVSDDANNMADSLGSVPAGIPKELDDDLNNLNDALTALWYGLLKNQGDDLNIWSDVINKLLGLRALVSDTMTMKDFFELDTGRVLSFADTINNLSDALTVSVLGLYLQQPTDTMSMSDGVSLFRTDAVQIGESLKNYLERLQILFNFLVTNADSMNNMSDSAVVNRISHPTKSVADTLNSYADAVSTNLAEVSNCFA